MAHDDMDHRGEVLVHDLGDLEGGQPLGERGEPSHVGHQHRDRAHLAAQPRALAQHALQHFLAHVLSEGGIEPPSGQVVRALTVELHDGQRRDEVQPVAAAVRLVAQRHEDDDEAQAQHDHPDLAQPNRQQRDPKAGGDEQRHVERPRRREQGSARQERVDDVRLDLHAAHQPHRRAVEIAALREGRAHQHDLVPERIVGVRADAASRQRHEGARRKRGEGAGLTDVVDAPHRVAQPRHRDRVVPRDPLPRITDRQHHLPRAAGQRRGQRARRVAFVSGQHGQRERREVAAVGGRQHRSRHADQAVRAEGGVGEAKERAEIR